MIQGFERRTRGRKVESLHISLSHISCDGKRILLPQRRDSGMYGTVLWILWTDLEVHNIPILPEPCKLPVSSLDIQVSDKMIA